MDTGTVILLAMAVSLFGCGYYLGRSHGYDAGEKANSGWENEALWWRKHATGIDDRARGGGDA